MVISISFNSFPPSHEFYYTKICSVHAPMYDKMRMMDKIDDLLTRGVANIIPNKNKMEKLLRSEKKLNIYNGIDPTSPKIHLGNTVPLRKLQLMVELGHNVTFLIGDFTTLIGDSSDKDSERPILTKDEIDENFKTYKKQAEKVLDFSKIKIVYNSQWLSKLKFGEIIKLCQNFSIGDFVNRELIRRRLDACNRVRLDEVLYPVMQGYDSYFMDTDIQFGGTDQTFNMQAGRTLQKNIRNKESFIVANYFLTGTDGRKMSKSWNNAIWIKDGPEEMYGKLMSVKDDLVVEYFTLATNIPLEEIAQLPKNPLENKKRLAYEITRQIHGEKRAKVAQDNFAEVFSQKGLPNDVPEYFLPKPNPTLLELISSTGLVKSKSEAKRLILQKAVEVAGNTYQNPHEGIDTSDWVHVKIGKRKFARVKSKNDRQQI